MTPAQAVESIQQRIASNGGALPHEIILTVYRRHADWAMPQIDGPSTEADFANAQACTAAVAEFFTRQGVRVLGADFDPAAYRVWLGSREDTRDHRAQWASHDEKVLAFTISTSSFGEALLRTKNRHLTLAFKITHNAIGWALLSDEAQSAEVEVSPSHLNPPDEDETELNRVRP